MASSGEGGEGQIQDDEERIQIGEEVKLEISDIANLTTPSIKLTPPVLNDIEVLG